ncbi:MAG: glycosyltransferase [Vicinamibacterales bacterium]
MPRPLRLLTTDRAPAYLRGLAALDARFDVLVADGDGLDAWWARLRELPESVRAIRPAQASERLARGVYDAVIAHSPSEALALGGAAPVVLVVHERRELAEAFGDAIADWDPQTRAAVGQARMVYSSPEAARSWAVDGPTIPLVVDAGDWPLGDLASPEAVTVTPFAVERAAFDTAYLLAQVLARVPVTVLGLNPGLGIEQDTAARPFRRRAFAHARAYLNLSSPAFETAAPSAMLEAMASGLPVITLAHPDTPVVDGVNGFAADDPEQLAARVGQLLLDQALALRLGSAARATVLGRARVSAFHEAWAELLAEVAGRSVRRVA